MTSASNIDIVIRLETIDQLFNAPDLNPFSDEEVNVLGEAALLRAVRRLQARRIHRWDDVRLVLALPAFVRGVLIVLAPYACSVLSFEAVWSVALDWIPFVQNNAVYGIMRKMALVIEARPDSL